MHGIWLPACEHLRKPALNVDASKGQIPKERLWRQRSSDGNLSWIRRRTLCYVGREVELQENFVTQPVEQRKVGRLRYGRTRP